MTIDPRKMFSLAGAAAAIALGAYGFDATVNRATVEAKVASKSLLPPLLGPYQQPMIRISSATGLKSNQLTFASGWFGRPHSSDIDRWKSIREGCRYRFTLHNRNARGGALYEILSFELLSCE